MVTINKNFLKKRSVDLLMPTFLHALKARGKVKGHIKYLFASKVMLAALKAAMDNQNISLFHLVNDDYVDGVRQCL
jgi:hypothetical protein